MLSVFSKHLPCITTEYFDFSCQVFFKVISSLPIESVQIKAIEKLPSFIINVPDPEDRLALSEKYFWLFLELSENDFEGTATPSRLTAMKSIIDLAEFPFLSDLQLFDFSQRILILINKIWQKRQKYRDDWDKMDEDEKKDADENVGDEDKVLLAIEDVLASIFKKYNKRVYFIIPNVISEL